MEEIRNRRKERIGIVISDKMDKTIVVNLVRRVHHPKYKKIVTKSTRVKVHDEQNEAKKGDRVKVREIRPLSKEKRWIYAGKVEQNRKGIQQ